MLDRTCRINKPIGVQTTGLTEYGHSPERYFIRNAKWGLQARLNVTYWIRRSAIALYAA